MICTDAGRPRHGATVLRVSKRFRRSQPSLPRNRFFFPCRVQLHAGGRALRSSKDNANAPSSSLSCAIAAGPCEGARHAMRPRMTGVWRHGPSRMSTVVAGHRRQTDIPRADHGSDGSPFLPLGRSHYKRAHGTMGPTSVIPQYHSHACSTYPNRAPPARAVISSKQVGLYTNGPDLQGKNGQ